MSKDIECLRYLCINFLKLSNVKLKEKKKYLVINSNENCYPVLLFPTQQGQSNEKNDNFLERGAHVLGNSYYISTKS